jgi:hypothetical protein
MTTVDYTDYDSLAEQAAGNWADFKCFAWFEQPENPDQFTVVYTSNRDSDILDRANAQAIQAELSQYFESGDVIPQRHSHWAVGHVDGYAIRVYDESENVTAAFRCWCDLMGRLDDYPILDESLYGEMEIEAQNESWELWARRDFIRAVESALDVTLDESDSSAMLTAFENARERSNTYWEGDSIDVERIAQAVTYDDVRALIVPIAVTVFSDGYVLARGSITGSEWECSPALYEPEFAACIDAMDKGADSVTLANHVLTWRAE